MGAVYTAAGAREGATGERIRVQGWGTEGRLYGGKCEPQPYSQNEQERVLQDDRNMIDRWS